MVMIMMLRQYICVGKLSNEKLLKGQITVFETLSEDIVPMALIIILDSCLIYLAVFQFYGEQDYGSIILL